MQLEEKKEKRNISKKIVHAKIKKAKVKSLEIISDEKLLEDLQKLPLKNLKWETILSEQNLDQFLELAKT